jgi:histidine ammonia-lyase
MKTKIIISGVLILTLSLSMLSCKNKEVAQPEAVKTTEATPNQTVDSTGNSTATVKDSLNTAPKAEKNENEKNEKE